MEILITCSRCKGIKSRLDFYNDASKKSGASSTCKSCSKQKSEIQRLNDPDAHRAYLANRYRQNKKSHNEKIRVYHNKKRREDPMFKFRAYLRTRIYKFFKKINQSKNTQSLLGCSWQEAYCFIESKFENGMSWENYGEWHVDHIVPLASATTVEELKNLCRFSNLQPLWAIDNFIKSDNI